MKPPPPQTPAELAKARRDAAEAEALRANLARRKAQARAKPPPAAAEKEKKCR